MKRTWVSCRLADCCKMAMVLIKNDDVLSAYLNPGISAHVTFVTGFNWASKSLALQRLQQQITLAMSKEDYQAEKMDAVTNSRSTHWAPSPLVVVFERAMMARINQGHETGLGSFPEGVGKLHVAHFVKTWSSQAILSPYLVMLRMNRFHIHSLPPSCKFSAFNVDQVRIR